MSAIGSRTAAKSAAPAHVAPLPERNDPRSILARAAQRARDGSLAYAGAVTPREAWLLQRLGAATIVDVRTRPEWELVGHVPGAPLVEWRRYGEQQASADFIAQLDNLAARDEPLLFLCRSGVRSHHAAQAAAAAGFTHAYNILEGFEGDIDSERRRGALGGWRHAGLPWIQT
ncbi:MAG TPA: rhodanese-like domain-containing protein [Usitatibacter sp.]|nr:rhodanese-like domain-containing protein [Usitatibacter sp.]